MRRENTDPTSDDDFDDKIRYYCTDVQFSPIAILDDAAAEVERISYTPYGVARHHPQADIDGDGKVELDDLLAISSNWGNFGIADIDRSGTVDLPDQLAVIAQWHQEEPAGDISFPAEDNIIGYDGYIFDEETQEYCVRFRHYIPELGRWVQRDPAGYVDGMSLYELVRSLPTGGYDPYGLCTLDPENLVRHHAYPLHLGGHPIEQGICEILDEAHMDKAHKYFRQNGFGYGSKGREAWAKLTCAEQRAHISKGLQAAGLKPSDASRCATLSMRGATPGISQSANRAYGKTIFRWGSGMMGGALTIFTITESCYAPTMPVDWREFGDNTAKCDCECTEFTEYWTIPSWWTIGTEEERDRPAHSRRSWESYGSLTAKDCASVEGVLEKKKVGGAIGYSIYEVTLLECRWNGTHVGIPGEPGAMKEDCRARDRLGPL